jgi:hypothetical protein
MISRVIQIISLLMGLTLLGCGGGDSWQAVERNLPGALLSVWGSSADDVWVVGGDAGDGQGPTVLHWDGTAFHRLATGQTGDLWWVFGFAGGPIFMGGAGGHILKYDNGTFTLMTTPGTDVVFGIWGSSPTDLWAVGGAMGGAQGAFAWRSSGGDWTVAPGFPQDLATTDALWKVYGRGANDVWMVGTAGKVVHWDGSALTPSSTGVGESLFTVHADAQRFVTVGGFGTGIILENEGAGWVDRSPKAAQPLVGVCLGPKDGYAVGQYGSVYHRDDSGWAAEDTGILLDESLHSVWIDPSGGVWAAGGQVLTTPLVRGVLLHKGNTIPGGIQ